MSVEPTPDPARAAQAARAAIAAAARARDARLDAAIADLSSADAARLDDEVRAGAAATLAATIGAIADAIGSHVARSLRDAGHPVAARVAHTDALRERLASAGALRERALADALLSDTRRRLLEPRLRATRAPDEPATPLAGYFDHPDAAVRDAWTTYLAVDGEATRAAPLPDTERRRVAWATAAAVAELTAADDPIVARAAADGAGAFLAGADQDEDRRAASATRLASALDLSADELGSTLDAALAEGRLTLFAAMLARGANVDHHTALTATLDPEPTALFAMLRAAAVARDEVARIGLRLCEADRMRDIEALPDAVDAAAALSDVAARAVVAPLALPEEYLAAARALQRGAR